jgi:lipopolysaccharide export system permease protein
MKRLNLTILDRYFLREITQTLLAVLLVLVLIMMSTKLTRFLKNAATGEWPTDVVLPMLGLTAVSSITLIMPMAVFLAVILAVGRFYKDNEMTVINGCGISTLRLYRPLGMMALALAIVMAVLSFYVIPITRQTIAYLEDQAEKTSEIAGISPGRFQESSNGRRVIYVEKNNEEQELMENVFVYNLGKDGQRTLVTAKSAYQYIEEGTGDTLIMLNNGYRYTGVPGHTKFRATQFELHWIRASEGEQGRVRHEYETKPTLDIISSDDPVDNAEFHWRLAMMLSPVLFTLLGLPMGRLKQREGRYGRIMMGVLIYIIYFKMLRVGQVMLEKESIPGWMGMWWIHLGLLAYLGWSLFRETRVRSGGWWARWRLARAKAAVS